jgi:hypothetical protein
MEDDYSSFTRNPFGASSDGDIALNDLLEVSRGGLKSLDDALLTATLTDAMEEGLPQRKAVSSPECFDAPEQASHDHAGRTQQLSQSHSLKQQFQPLYGSEASMEDPLYSDTTTTNEMGGSSRESFGITSKLLGNFEEDPGCKKTISFADKIATLMGEDVLLGSESSLQTLDIFEDETKATTMIDTSVDVGDQDSFDIAIDEDEDEEDKKMRRQLMYAVGGVGFFALMGFAAKNLLKIFDKTVNDNQDIDGGMDISNAADGLTHANDLATVVAGDGGSSATSAASATHAAEASASSSQSQVGTAGGLGMNPGATGGQAGGGQMSAAQTQVVQNMAVNAASNAASSAASLSSAIASAAAAAAGTAAGATAAAATVATVATVVSRDLESCFGGRKGISLFSIISPSF